MQIIHLSQTHICAHSVPGPVVLFPGEEYRTLMPASLLLLLKRVPSAPVEVRNRGHHFIAGKAWSCGWDCLPFGASFPGQGSIESHSQTIPKSEKRVWCSEWHLRTWRELLEKNVAIALRLQLSDSLDGCKVWVTKLKTMHEVSRDSWDQAVRQGLFLYLIQLKLWLLMWYTITHSAISQIQEWPCPMWQARTPNSLFLHMQEGLGTRLAFVAWLHNQQQ